MHGSAEQLIARLRSNPQDIDAFAALKHAYQQRGDWASLTNLLEDWAERSHHAAAASRALYEAGELCRTRLKDHERATYLYEGALQRNPNYAAASDRLCDLLRQRGDYQRLLSVLQHRSHALEQAQANPRAQAEVWHRIGEVFEHGLHQTDLAIDHYRRAVQTDSSYTPAIRAARELFGRMGNANAMLRLYEMEISAEVDAARKVALLRDLAHLRTTQLGDVEGAVAALRRALSASPADAGVMHDLASAFMNRAEAVRSPERAHEDRSQAADLFFKIAQSALPEHALGYLQAALDARPDHDAALDLLELKAEECGQGDLLPPFWVAFLDASQDAQATLGVRRKLGSAYADAEQWSDAVECWTPLLASGDPPTLAAFASLYEKLGIDDPRISVLRSALDLVPVEHQANVLRNVLQLLEVRGDYEVATEYALRLLEIVPADEGAFSTLASHYRAGQRWDELRNVLVASARAATLPVKIRRQRLVEAANLSEIELGDRQGACDAWRAVVSLDPSDRDALRSLEALLTQEGRWDGVAELLREQALTSTDAESQVELYRRIATICQERLGAPDRGLEALCLLLELQPNDLGALEQLCNLVPDAPDRSAPAIPFLRSALDAVPSDLRHRMLWALALALEAPGGDLDEAFSHYAELLERDPSDLDAIGRMERIAAEKEDWERLLQTLSYKVEVVDAAMRGAVLQRMAELADRVLEDPTRAAGYYARALDENPEDSGLFTSVCDAYQRSGRYRDLIVNLRKRADTTQDVRLRAALWRRIAMVLSEHLRNEDAAAEAWAEVLNIQDDVVGLDYLIRINRNRSDFETLASLLERRAHIEPESTKRRDLLFSRATLLHRELDEPREAAELARTILDELDPGYGPAVQMLLETSDHLGDPAGLADALSRQLALVDDQLLQRPIAARLAVLCHEELGDTARAIEACRLWTEADPANPESWRLLATLLEETGQWEPLVRALDSLAQTEREPESAAEASRRCAQILREFLGDLSGAWNRLTPLLQQQDDQATATLWELAIHGGREQELGALYAELAQSESDPRAQARCFHMASRAAEQIGDLAQAFDLVEQAFMADPGDTDLLDDIDRLGGQVGAWTRLVPIYDAALQQCEDPRVKIGLLVRHAAMLGDQAGDPSAALDRILRACALAIWDDDILSLAEDLAPRAERPVELLVVYDRRRAQAESPSATVDALVRSALLCDEQLGERDRANGHLAHAAQFAIEGETLRDRVESTAHELQRKYPAAGLQDCRQALIAAYEEHAGQSDEAEDAVAFLRLAANLATRELEDTPQAFQLLAKAVERQPSDGGLLDDLEALASCTGNLEAYQHQLGQLADEVLDKGTACALLERRAALLDRELGRYAEAAATLGQLLTLRRDDPKLLADQKDCLRRAGSYQELLGVLDRELRRTDDSAAKLAVAKEIADIWETALGNRWEATDAWKYVRKLAPDDPEVVDAMRRLEAATSDALSTNEELSIDSIQDDDAEDDEDCGADDGMLVDVTVVPYEESDPTSPSVLYAAMGAEVDPTELLDVSEWMDES